MEKLADLGSENRYDAVLVGAGIMSTTLAVLLNELDPDMKLLIIERLSAPALESTAAFNNAGTGHAANCELNYTPLQSDGTVKTAKALSINKSFEQSLELWASLSERGRLDPKTFLNVVPHISFVWGEPDVAFLLQRFRQLNSFEAFSSMQLTTDCSELADWMPLVMDGRDSLQPMAATRVERGTDIDFGALTRAYLADLQRRGATELSLSTEVNDLHMVGDELWEIELQTNLSTRSVYSPFVFLGAGGGALTLLQKSKVSESLAYGGFPVSGKWLVCSNSELADKHNAKVYGSTKIGAPPMSVPHLDSRWIEGKRSLLFGPFAGFSTKFLKEGSNMDLFRSISSSNFSSMINVGLQNYDLIKYLIAQITLSNEDRIKSLREFLPRADETDWELSIAGQRVQIIKSSKKKAVLQMGTEVVATSNGSLAALLGASPGASTAVTIMIEVLQRCFSKLLDTESGRERLKKLLPNFTNDSTLMNFSLSEARNRNNSLLNLK